VIPLGGGVEVYLALEPVDMRKAMDGLSVLVEDVHGLNPLSGQLFVSGNRRRDKIKILPN
jgi:transposase